MAKILIVIPARKGSSFHRKNLHLVLGSSLLKHAINSSKVDQDHDTLVTTDDPFVYEEANANGIRVDERPKNLADDVATLDQVMFYVATTYNDYDLYVCLPPTSPGRTQKHVQDALKEFLDDGRADSSISVTEERRSIWKRDPDGFIKPLVERSQNRQEVQPVYVANGAIFISKRDNILKSKKKVSGRIIHYVMDSYDSVDVHEARDLRLAEFLIKR